LGVHLHGNGCGVFIAVSPDEPGIKGLPAYLFPHNVSSPDPKTLSASGQERGVALEARQAWMSLTHKALVC
jgi:hypothetical protein